MVRLLAFKLLFNEGEKNIRFHIKNVGKLGVGFNYLRSSNVNEKKAFLFIFMH